MRVELSRVSRRFGSVAALRDVSLDLASGERVALIGPNGAGKSTLTRIIMGMLSCTGEVRVDGCSPFADRARLAHKLAYVPQVAPQLGATVGEMLRTIATLRGVPVAHFVAAAAELGLDADGMRRRPMRGLSGGMRQKLLLALALASAASLLILDEPTASLDVGSRRRFFELIDELPGRPSIILCSHRLEEIRHLVDRVLVLEDGSVRFDGPADVYLRRTGLGVLEVQASSERAGSWLTAKGFHSGAAGWWHCEVRNGERIELISDVVSSLGVDLCDIVVRDVERLSDVREEDPRPSDVVDDRAEGAES